MTTQTAAEVAFCDAVRETTEMVLSHRMHMLAAVHDGFALSSEWADGTQHYMEQAFTLQRLCGPAFLDGNPYIPAKTRVPFVLAWMKAVDDLVVRLSMPFDLSALDDDGALSGVVRDICASVLEFGDYLFNGFLGHFEASNSPLERAFLVGYTAYTKDAFDDLCDSDRFRSQFSVNGYRLDFAYFPVELPGKIAIELDGHTYHERTVEQAVHDRARDRVLQSDGWQVLRFHRAEVERDLAACIANVRTNINNICGGLIATLTQ